MSQHQETPKTGRKKKVMKKAEVIPPKELLVAESIMSSLKRVHRRGVRT